MVHHYLLFGKAGTAALTLLEIKKLEASNWWFFSDHEARFLAFALNSIEHQLFIEIPHPIFPGQLERIFQIAVHPFIHLQRAHKRAAVFIHRPSCGLQTTFGAVCAQYINGLSDFTFHKRMDPDSVFPFVWPSLLGPQGERGYQGTSHGHAGSGTGRRNGVIGALSGGSILNPFWEWLAYVCVTSSCPDRAQSNHIMFASC